MKRKLFTFAVLATVAVGGAFAGTASPTKINVDDTYLNEDCQPVHCGDYQTTSCGSLILYAPNDCGGTPVIASGEVRPF